MSEVATCARCNDTGKHTVVESFPGGGMSCMSNPCICRMQMEPREGEARWWSTEDRTVGAIDEPLLNASIALGIEIPMSADNYRVVMRGNRYYAVGIYLDYEPCCIGIGADDARALARLLIEAADQADAIDNADKDACGHWAPCNCGGA